MKLFLSGFFLLFLFVPLSLTGCSPQLSEEETPVMVTDEDETEDDIEFGPDNP